jgi:ABC-2 type transport system ATP-binding protein
VISAVGLTRHFGTRVAVDDVSLSVGPSEIVALLGPNGAGKTTTLRMLGGLIAPTNGSTAIDGIALTCQTADSLRGRVGFLPETPGLWDRLSVRENLRIYAGLYAVSQPERTVDRALDLLGLADRASTLTAELSKGMRQKVALARTLLHEPANLLLDEPTSGLDPEVARSVRHLLDRRRAAGCAILVSTHNLDEAERLADRIAVMNRTLLALDRPSALRQRLTAGHIVIRVAARAATLLDTARAFDPNARADGALLVLTLQRLESETPALVRKLVERGADVLEVRPEQPALEDVYLSLLGRQPAPQKDAAS